MAHRGPAEPAAAESEIHVLVVGAGLTGVLAAARLRARADAAGRPLRLTVWERATYPSGRFGATAAHGAAVADLGSQVLSTVDPRDERAQPGHGISTGAARAAWALRGDLVARGLLTPAPDEALGAVEERLNWPRLWHHAHAPRGLGAVLRALLEDARPDAVRFGLRVDGVAATHAGGTAWGVQRHGDGASTPLRESFDSVILAVPAPDAARVANVAASLPPASAAILHGVGYDRRVATAIFYENGDGLIGSRLAALCGARGATELDFDDADEARHGIHLIAWQGAKGPRDAARGVVVAHSVASGHGRDDDLRAAVTPRAVHDALERAGIGLTADALAERTLATRTIDWRVAQMIRPAESLVGAPSFAPPVLAATGGDDKRPWLLLAGDFLSQSSFLGCVASAHAAADAALGLGNEPQRDTASV